MSTRIATVIIADIEDDELTPLTYLSIKGKVYPTIDDVMDDLAYALNVISIEYEVKRGTGR